MTNPGLRIPFTLSVVWAVHTTATPPHSTPEPDERVGAVGLEVSLLPMLLKASSWTIGFVEVVALCVRLYPSKDLSWRPFTSCSGPSKFATGVLVHPIADLNGLRLTWTTLFAWLCTIIGAIIRRSCYRAMQDMFTFELSLRKNHRLVTSGPYSIVRHPSYIGAAMALFGALTYFLTPGSWVVECSGLGLPLHSKSSALLTLCWSIASIMAALTVCPRIKQEDAILRQRFGSEWEAWAAKVPYRLIPGLY